MLRHFGYDARAVVAAWLLGWPGWLSGVGLEGPRREEPRGVEGKSGVLGPYPHSKDPQLLYCKPRILKISILEEILLL